MGKENIIKGTITINPNDLTEPLQRNLTICSNGVYMALAMLNDLKELPETIFGEDEFLVHGPHGDNLALDLRKQLFKDWIIKKGFEDLIKAISEMLIGYCRVLNFQEKLKSVSTTDEYNNLSTTLDYEPTSKHFPDLLKKLNKHLKEPLLFEDCIMSINKVRACLVHRNGYVSPKDCNQSDKLVLKWAYFNMNIVNGETKQKLEKFSRLNGGFSIQLNQEIRTKEFPLQKHIEITYQEFNELITTCYLFSDDLLRKFQIERKL